MYVVVFKNDNFRPSVYGPFDDRETATAWGEKESIHEEFWVTPLVTAVPHES